MTNPTKYHLSLTLPSDRLSDSLSFLQSFHKEWKLYPGRSFKCSESTTMTGQDISYLPISYTISSGDTLSGVVDTYATTVDNLVQWNTGWTQNSGLTLWQEMIVWQKTIVVHEYQTTECIQSGYAFFEGEELSYLWQKPLREESHEVVNEYANGWMINLNDNLTWSDQTTYLTKWLREGRITRNDDWSYQVNLVLYFRPQSWFYVGLMISGATLVSLLGRLARDRRRRRRNLDK